MDYDRKPSWAKEHKGKFYVNCYETYRCYGGPEEGGWWYTAWSPIERVSKRDEQGYSLGYEKMSWVFDNWEDADKFQDILIAEAKAIEKGNIDEVVEARAEMDGFQDFIKEAKTFRMGYGEHDGCDSEGIGDDDYLITGGRWGRADWMIRVESETAENGSETPYYC